MNENTCEMCNQKFKDRKVRAISGEIVWENAYCDACKRKISKMPDEH